MQNKTKQFKKKITETLVVTTQVKKWSSTVP